jgi:undecaprenyl-diphosphatase
MSEGPGQVKLTRRLDCVALVTLTLFITLSFFVMRGKTMPFDLWLRSLIHEHASSIGTTLATVSSFLGSTVWLACLTIVLAATLFFSGWRRVAFRALLIMAGAVVLNNVLKYTFQRPRPSPFFGIAPESFSYPSGHAIYSTTFYLLAATILVKVKRPAHTYAFLSAMILVVLVSWSRIYLGVHYPSDVIAGLLAGTFWFALCVRIWLIPLEGGRG